MRAEEIPIPETWPNIVRKAVIHAISLANYAIIYTRSMNANSPIERVRLKGKLNRAENEIALLKEQLELVKNRFRKIPAKHRPHYSPFERMVILEHRAARGWNLKRTADEFLLDEQTLSDWMRRIDDEGKDALIKIPEPINKYPDFLKYLAQRLKLLSPSLGRKKIAEYFLRSGLNLSASSVRRFLKSASPPKDDSTMENTAEKEKPEKKITSRHPNHTWMIDLTTVPTGGGFWVSWLPNALHQCWPFCYWIGVIIDHFSRKVIGFAVFRKQPDSKEITQIMNKAAKRTKHKPKYIITDKGSQFTSEHYKSWCSRKKIRPRYGAVGKYGSIAIVERFIKSMKTEHLCRIMVPLSLNEMRYETGLYLTWYNEYRPHSALGGFRKAQAKARTPQEVYMQSSPIPILLFQPKSKIPEFAMDCRYFEGKKHLPVISRRAA